MRGNSMEKLTLALIAHDGKKEEMVKLAREHKDNPSKLTLVATRSTGQLVREGTGLAITLVNSGPLGGDQQIGQWWRAEW
jgi:methylglyoxal synthase